MKSGAKKDFILPIVVLTVICLVMSTLLALANQATAPIIADNEKAVAEAARAEVLPEAEGFEEVKSDSFPDSIVEVYKAVNDCGYVITILGDGYGGKDTLRVICGIDSDGLLVESKLLAHSETAGLGSKVGEDDFKGQFVGKDSALEGINVISGASISSNHYISAIRDAFAAYEIAEKEGKE